MSHLSLAFASESLALLAGRGRLLPRARSLPRVNSLLYVRTHAAHYTCIRGSVITVQRMSIYGVAKDVASYPGYCVRMRVIKGLGFRRLPRGPGKLMLFRAAPGPDGYRARALW